MFHAYILREILQRCFFFLFPSLFCCFHVSFLHVRVRTLFGEAQEKHLFISVLFCFVLHCSQWSWMDSCQAYLGQLLALDQVPEITTHFLWVKVVSLSEPGYWSGISSWWWSLCDILKPSPQFGRRLRCCAWSRRSRRPCWCSASVCGFRVNVQIWLFKICTVKHMLVLEGVWFTSTQA